MSDQPTLFPSEFQSGDEMIRLTQSQYDQLARKQAATSSLKTPTIVCEECGTETKRTGTMQRFCPECSNKRSLAMKSKWAKENPQVKTTAQKRKNYELVSSRRIQRGLSTNRECVQEFSWQPFSGMEMSWQVTVQVPFSYAMSKNHAAAFVKAGHLYLRSESKAMKKLISDVVTLAVAGLPVVHNKVWLAMMVQKESHRGDAINVIDLVADSIKHVLKVDDRWFCISCVDWMIVKDSPQLILSIGQQSPDPSQVCSYCGRILPYTEFHSNKNHATGFGRECVSCSGHLERRGSRHVREK